MFIKFIGFILLIFSFQSFSGGGCSTINYEKIKNMQGSLKIGRASTKEYCGYCSIRLSKYFITEDESNLKFTIRERMEILQDSVMRRARSMTQTQILEKLNNEIGDKAKIWSLSRLDREIPEIVPPTVNKSNWLISKEELYNIMSKLPDSSNAIVGGDLYESDKLISGHVFNVVNDNGKIVAVDSSDRVKFMSSTTEADTYFRSVYHEGKNLVWYNPTYPDSDSIFNVIFILPK